VTRASSGMNMALAVNATLSARMATATTTKSAMMETSRMRTGAPVTAQLKKTTCACRLIPPPLVRMCASATPSRYPPHGLSSGDKLKSNSGALSTITLRMGQNLLTLKFSARRFLTQPCLKIRIWEPSMLASWMRVLLRALSELLLT